MRTTRLCLVLAIVAAGLVTVPATASAKAKDQNKGFVAITQLDKKQNNAIREARRRAARAHARIVALKEWNQALSDWNGSQDQSLTGVQGTLATIVAGVPDIIGGLTQLRDGLLAVQGVLQNTVAPALTGLQGGLTQLGSAYQAVEYGAAKGTVTLPAGCGGTTSLTPALVTPDIPDDGNPAGATGTLPINVAACPAVAGNIVLGMRGAIRSNEGDGAATGDPAGQGGGVMVVTCGSGPCQDGSGAAKDPGEIVCTAQTPNDDFDLPNGSTTNQPLVTIQEKVARTATDEPTATSTDIMGGETCAVKGGAVYVLTPTVQFVDIPTSLTPGPTA